MRQVPLLLLLFTILETGYGQDFRKGYIVDARGDTVRGLVRYREGARVFRSCDFKREEQGEAATYTAGEILGYGIVGERVYAFRKIKVNDADENVFLEVLVRGEVTLYRFEFVFYASKGDDSLVELDNKIKTIESSDGRIIRMESKRYVAVLTALMADCPATEKKLKSVDYAEKSLTELTLIYNRCKNGPVTEVKAGKTWLRAAPGVSAGVNFSNLSFQSFLPPDAKVPVEAVASPHIDLSLDLFFPRVSERMSIHAEAQYFKSTYSNHEVIALAGVTIRNSLTIELEQLKIPVGLRFEFGKRSFTPFFNLGIISTVLLNSTSSYFQELVYPTYTETYDRPATHVDSVEPGFWGGLGVNHSLGSKFDATLELRYDVTSKVHSTNSTTPGVDYPASLNNLQVTVGVRMK